MEKSWYIDECNPQLTLGPRAYRGGGGGPEEVASTSPSPHKDQSLSTKGKIVSKYCNISNKTQVRGSIQPPPPTLYHGGAMNLRVRPGVKWR